MNQPDKAAVTAYYDEQGFCHSIEVRLNAAGLSREDVAEAVRSVFQPGALSVPRTIAEASGSGPAPAYRHHELGGTAIIQMRAPSTRTDNGTVINGSGTATG